jgi:hypothetical protein
MDLSDAARTTQDTTSSIEQSGSPKMATRVRGAMMAVSQNQGERMLTLCIGVSESERKGEGRIHLMLDSEASW